jgi:CBS domain-containing protein
MSGGPVLDREVGGIIGIISERYISERYITESDVDKHLSFAIPVSTIIAIFPEIVK